MPKSSTVVGKKPKVTLKGTIRPKSFKDVWASSSKEPRRRPGKKFDKRPAVFASVRRAMSMKKGEVKKWFLLDTGAERSCISEKDAKVLKLLNKSTGRKLVKNALGKQVRKTVRVAITVLENGKKLASVQLTATIRGGKFRHGILGMDFVAALGWENIDFKGGKKRKREGVKVKKKPAKRKPAALERNKSRSALGESGLQRTRSKSVTFKDPPNDEDSDEADDDGSDEEEDEDEADGSESDDEEVCQEDSEDEQVKKAIKISRKESKKDCTEIS